MSTNVRPGDRAVIVKAHRPENLGIIVEVVGPHAPGSDINGEKTFVVRPDLASQPWWLVESLGRPIVTTKRFTPGEFPRQVWSAYDGPLRRLPRPDEMDDATPAQDSRPVLEETA